MELREVNAHFAQRRIDSLERAIKRHESGGSVSRKYRHAYAHDLSEANLFGTVAATIDENRLTAARARPSRFDTSAVENLARALHARDVGGQRRPRPPLTAKFDPHDPKP